MNGKKLSLFLIFIGLILMTSGIVYASFNNNSNENKEGNNNSEIQIDKKEISINGVYQLDDLVVKVLKVEEVNINNISKGGYISFSVNGNYKGILDKKGNKYISSLFEEEIEFDFKENSVFLTFNKEALEENKNFKNGLFKKTKDYTEKDYFEDNIGNSELFFSKYNGIYEYDGKSIYVFQKDLDKVYVYIVGKSQNSHGSFITVGSTYLIDKTNDNRLNDLYDENVEFILFNADTLEFNSNEYNDFTGVYTKKDTLTFSQAVTID